MRITFLTMLLATVCPSPPVVTAMVIDLADARGIRDDPDPAGPYLLDALVIEAGLDRTALQFDVSGLAGTLDSVTLDLWVENFDPGGADGIIDVFSYIGDGVVTPNEFSAGGPGAFTSFAMRDLVSFIRIDVTPVVQSSLDAGDPFLGFRLSTQTFDRFELGSGVNLNDPVLAVVPEPAALFLLACGAVAVLCRRLRSSSLGAV